MTTENSKLLNEARKLIKHNELVKALVILEGLYISNKDDSTITYEYGMLLSKLKKYEDAKNVLSIFFNDNSKYSITSLVQLSKLSLEQGKLHEAKEYYNLLKKVNYTLSKDLLAKIKIAEGNYDQASKIYKEVGKKFVNGEMNKKALKVEIDKEILEYDLEEINRLFNSIYMLIHESKYEEALTLYENLCDYNLRGNMKLTNDLKLLGFYLKAKLTETKVDTESYLEQQMLSYDLDLAIAHSSRTFESSKSKGKKMYINEDINLEELYKEIKEKISQVEPTDISYVDKYYVEFASSIGVDQGHETSMVKVVTLANTKDIVTIYPYYDTKNKVKKLEQ